ncbi:hypothetical Protein YC6258_04011 [Gynuella sunshinyii YC6258]|uniref:Uncharacterized protein n=1 Tax=Gynuella sunshinyii YC6258 TaxID=1445510 RepID=A0A0C5VMT9_9GAMM|nr:hypothetical Protein YC6258_04011 [Gynuella sunshinyii YC6258]
MFFDRFLAISVHQIDTSGDITDYRNALVGCRSEIHKIALANS